MARIWNKYKTNTPLKRKVLVFMSGGVDSSVAAALLARAGHEVTGVFTVDYDDPASPNCWRGDYQDAVRVAAKLGIKLLRWDFTKEY
ncbi:MAG TPA: asparagine synthase-related protein, partial [Patescibacteria group bacterium]|nr:asparagine synthase-related protein [Patescibacteria group bacterium]